MKNHKKIKTKSKNNIWILKSDAYGLGIRFIAPLLYSLNEKYFAVSKLEHALIIKKMFSDSKVLLMARVDENQIEDIIKNDIEISLFDNKGLKLLKKYEDKLKIHIKLNLSLNRLGFEDIPDIKHEAIYSHMGLLNIDEDIRLFKAKTKNYKCKKHLFASELIFLKKQEFDYARIGMAIYGLCNLEQIFEIKARIIQVRNVKKGDIISYNKKAEKDMKIGIIELGYSDGILFNEYVYYNNQKVDLISFNMDLSFVDLSFTDAKEDEYIYLEKIDIISERQNVLAENILTSLSKNIKRTVVDD